MQTGSTCLCLTPGETGCYDVCNRRRHTLNTVTIELSATVNIWNFNSVKVGVAETRTVPVGVPFEEARRALYAELEDFLTEKIKEVRKDAGI